MLDATNQLNQAIQKGWRLDSHLDYFDRTRVLYLKEVHFQSECEIVNLIQGDIEMKCATYNTTSIQQLKRDNLRLRWIVGAMIFICTMLVIFLPRHAKADDSINTVTEGRGPNPAEPWVIGPAPTATPEPESESVYKDCCQECDGMLFGFALKAKEENIGKISGFVDADKLHTAGELIAGNTDECTGCLKEHGLQKNPKKWGESCEGYLREEHPMLFY